LLASLRVTTDVRHARCGYEVSASVRHERLDDEVIAIDLDTGAYFALDGVAAVCWSLLAAGGAVDAVVDMMAADFEAARDTVQSDVQRFVAELVQMHLLTPVDREPVSVESACAMKPTSEYRAPAIERFDDLEELLVLDPIHEVDEAGWPATRADK
jgi:hypothetical protein